MNPLVQQLQEARILQSHSKELGQWQSARLLKDSDLFLQPTVDGRNMKKSCRGPECTNNIFSTGGLNFLCWCRCLAKAKGVQTAGVPHWIGGGSETDRLHLKMAMSTFLWLSKKAGDFRVVRNLVLVLQLSFWDRNRGNRRVLRHKTPWQKSIQSRFFKKTSRPTALQ